VLFLLFGSSAAGKTAALNGVREHMPNLAVHDFDEIGVPPDADTAWRQRANEIWLRRALDLQADGHDLLLAGQVPLGEVLAAPSASQLDAISACLLDCDDETRVGRIRARGSDWLDRVPGDLQDHLNWAEWMRHHAGNPTWRQYVIRQAGAEEMRWERWARWHEGDSRWQVRVIDTSGLLVDRVVDELTSWIEHERELLRSGLHPLAAAELRNLDSAPNAAD
jgi:hypothetical protein